MPDVGTQIPDFSEYAGLLNFRGQDGRYHCCIDALTGLCRMTEAKMSTITEAE